MDQEKSTLEFSTVEDVIAAGYKFILVRKKPVIVSAVRIDKPYRVYTPEGIHEGVPGSWLICGVRGELYSCKDDILRATYDILGDLIPSSSPCSECVGVNEDTSPK